MAAPRNRKHILVPAPTAEQILSCNAADLAERGVVAAYPVSGWWNNQPKRDRSAKVARYSLVVSIETPGVEADILTPVAQPVGVPLLVET